MKIHVLLSALYAIAVWLLVPSVTGAIYVPAVVAGFMMGLIVNNRPHRQFVKTGSITATMFALVIGVIAGFIDKETYQSTWTVLAVFFVLSYVANALGLLAAFLFKEIATHVRGSLR